MQNICKIDFLNSFEHCILKIFIAKSFGNTLFGKLTFFTNQVVYGFWVFCTFINAGVKQMNRTITIGTLQ